MEKNTFLEKFVRCLISGGISHDTALSVAKRLSSNFTRRDLERIDNMKDDSDVERISRAYIKKLNEMKSQNGQQTSEETNGYNGDDTGTFTARIAPVTPSAKQNIAQNNTTKSFDQVKNNPGTPTRTDKDNVIRNQINNGDDMASTGQYRKIKKDPIIIKSDRGGDVTVTEKTETRKIEAVKKLPAKVMLTTEGKKEYSKEILKRSPVICAVGALSITGIAVSYGGITILIALFIVLMIFFTIAGCVGGIAGIIYGIVKLFSVVPEGIYEIGLALVIFGVLVALAILCYNMAIRLIPKLWQKLTVYISERRRDFRDYLNRLRTECNRP